MKVLVVVGTRPEAIKMAPVVKALEREASLTPMLLVTGQHTDLVESALRTFDLEPEWNLDLMTEDQSLYEVAERCLKGVGGVLNRSEPEMMLVQGDTATVLFASLSGYFEQTRVGHVEAGLRSHDKWRPFPEEMFRRLSDGIADFHFAPTPSAAENLRHEGVAEESIFVTGNPVVDSVERIVEESTSPSHSILRTLTDEKRCFVLVTLHRRESFGDPMREVFGAIRSIANSHNDVEFLYPVHPNPKVKGPAREILSGHARIHLTEPLEYEDLLQALANATLVLTDSGGIQEEAPTFGTPVLVVREVTERPEGVDAGVARLVGTDRERIVSEVSRLLTDEGARDSMIKPVSPYGDGRAGERIADIVGSDLLGRPRRIPGWPGIGEQV